MKLKFSIIITVYNTLDIYLSECIDSVISQTYDNIEIIIIDDGSSNSDIVSCLRKYETANFGTKSLTVIHQNNGGQGKARNVGMSVARGNYWVFLDSDDYYMSNTLFSELSVLLEESKADLCVFEYAEFFNDNTRPRVTEGSLPRNKVFGKSLDKAMKSLLSSPRCVFSGATHTKVIKASMMQKHNISAPEGLKNEDNYLSAKIVCYAKTLDRYNKVVHAYRRSNVCSLTTMHDNSYNIADDILKQFDMLLSDKDCASNINVLNFLASPYVYVMGKVVSAKINLPNENIEILIDKLVKYSYVLKYSSRLSVYLMGIVVRVFGINFALVALRIFLSVNSKHMLSINRKMN